MPAGPVSVWTVIGRVVVALNLLAACTSSDPPGAGGPWLQQQSMAIARSEIPAAVVTNTIYVPGGLVATSQGVGVASSVERYRVETDTWDRVADLPAPRHHSMSAALGGRVYVFGGFGEGFDPWATAWRFDPLANGWTELTDLPFAQGAGAAVEIEGLIYIAGGVPNGTSFYVYDPVDNAWTALPPMTQPREHTAAVAFQGDMWVLGGRWGDEMLSSTEIYDPESGKWSSGPAMQEARSGFGATVLGERIFVAGGEVFEASDGFQAAALDSVERYDGNAWTFTDPLPQPLHGVPLAAAGDAIYLLGGSIEAAGVDNTGEVWSLEVDE
jgi:N-acetylneuraminic acid mutarotase